MIIGIGSDLIDIRRIEKTLERFGERFTNRIFTDIEKAKSERRRLRAASYAKRFAAKEACSKALGTGLSRGVYWRDMGGGQSARRQTFDASDEWRCGAPGALNARRNGRADRHYDHRRLSTGAGIRRDFRCSARVCNRQGPVVTSIQQSSHRNACVLPRREIPFG